MTEPHPLDDPERRRSVVRTLLILSPFLFIGSYLLAAVQGAPPRESLLIAGVALAMCLGAALVIHLMGSKSGWALVVVQIVLALAKKR